MAFGRVIELTVGPANAPGTTVKDLFMSFEVEKSTDPSQNTIKVSVYNLSKDTARRMGVKGQSLILRAGYEDEVVSALAFGDVTLATIKPDGVDTVLELEARDGHKELSSASISISKSKGTSAKSVLQSVADALTLPVVGLNKADSSVQYVNGYSYCGPVRGALAEITAKLQVSWMIVNQQLVILSPSEPLDGTGLDLTPDTGLLSAPEPVDNATDDPNADAKSGRWKIITLLFPQMSPGAKIKVRSSAVNGYFRVEKCSYKGDNRDGDFTVEAEIIELASLSSAAGKKSQPLTRGAAPI